MLFKMGRYLDSLKYYQRTFSLLYTKLGENSIHTVNARIDLGEVYSCLGQFNEALANYQKALKYFKKTWGLGHNSVSRIYCNIGLIHYHQGDNNKALQYYEKSERVRQEFLKKNIGGNMLIRDDFFSGNIVESQGLGI